MPDEQQISRYLQKYVVSDEETLNIGVNFSIIKHNEYKSYNFENHTTSTKNCDIGVESQAVQDPTYTQDYQMTANRLVSRDHRTVFLEKMNKYILNKDYNEDTLN